MALIDTLGWQLVCQMALNATALLLKRLKKRRRFSSNWESSRVHCSHTHSLLGGGCTKLLWRDTDWSLSGGRSCEPVDLASDFPPYHVATCWSICVLYRSCIFFGQCWAADEHTSMRDTVVVGDGEPAAGRFPLSPCIVQLWQFPSDPSYSMRIPLWHCHTSCSQQRYGSTVQVPVTCGLYGLLAQDIQ